MTDTAYPTYGKPPPGLAVTGDNYDPPTASSMAIGQAGRGAEGCERRLAQLQGRLAAAKVMRGETRMMAVEASLTMEQQVAGAAIRGLTREIVSLQNALLYIDATEDGADRAELIARTGDGEG